MKSQTMLIDIRVSLKHYSDKNLSNRFAAGKKLETCSLCYEVLGLNLILLMATGY